MKFVNNLNNSSQDYMFYMYVFRFLSILSFQQDVYVFISFSLIKFNNEKPKEYCPLASYGCFYGK